MVKSLFSTGHMSAIKTSGAKLAQHDDVENGIACLAGQHRSATCPERSRVSGADLQNQDFGHARAQRSCGLDQAAAAAV